MRTQTADTRQRILDAAARLFAVQRFHEVRMDDLATEAEVAKGTLYRYFRDKEELYNHLIASAATQILQKVDEGAASASEPEPKLVAMLQASFWFFENHPFLSDLLQRVEALSPSATQFAWNDVRKELAARVEETLAQPCLGVRDPACGALMLMGSLRQLHRFAKRPLPKDLVEQVVRVYLHGAASHGQCDSGPYPEA
jgi:AcrR family transcriptional regulator